MAASNGNGLIPTGVTSDNTAGALLVEVEWTQSTTGPSTQALSGFYVCVESDAELAYTKSGSPATMATPCTDFDAVMRVNTAQILPETTTNTYDDNTAVKWDGSIRDMKTGNPEPDWHDPAVGGTASAVDVTVCAITFRRAFCAATPAS